MAGSPNVLPTAAGFLAGVNNVAPDQDLPVDAQGVSTSLREAVNVDLVGPKKKPRRRAGYTRVITGRCHSPGQLKQLRTLVLVVDGDLRAYDRQLALVSTLRAGVGDRHLSYADVNDDLYWSNGLQLRRIRGSDLADTPGWIACPGTPNATAVAGGGMAAGAYRVGMTWFDADGRESGCAGLAEVDVPEGFGIRVDDIPAAPEGAVKARVYVSTANGEICYAATDLLTGATSTMLGAGAGDGGKALETLWREPLPPCDILRFWNGRLLGASRNLLIWSDALRFGLTTHDNYLRLGAGITLLEPVGDGASGGSGVWVADHKRTYWMEGGEPDKWRRVIRYDYAAVPGTSVLVKGTDVGLETTEQVAFWLATNGVFCVGLPGGKLEPVTEGRLALPDGERGATLFREHNGLRQLITSYLSRAGNGLAIGDKASATVTRHP